MLPQSSGGQVSKARLCLREPYEKKKILIAGAPEKQDSKRSELETKPHVIRERKGKPRKTRYNHGPTTRRSGLTPLAFIYYFNNNTYFIIYFFFFYLRNHTSVH